MHEVVEFESQGAILRGWLYRPRGIADAPIVIMAHGFSATLRMTADRYAEVLCDAGFAVLLYDHRNFGISGGEPRQQIDLWLQARGYIDALDFVVQLPEVDRERIGIWGDSLSGAEVIIVGAVDPRVKAVVAQVPACGADRAPPDPDGVLFRAMADRLLQGDFDPPGGAVRGPLPVVSSDQAGTPSFLPPVSAFRWFIEYGGRHGTGWENSATMVDSAAHGIYHAGLAARHLNVPLLAIIAPEDEMPRAVPAIAFEVFHAVLGEKQLLKIAAGHFGLLHWPSDEFTAASTAQRDFLHRHLA